MLSSTFKRDIEKVYDFRFELFLYEQLINKQGK